MPLDDKTADALTDARHATPFDVLGLHPLGDSAKPGRVLRASHPSAKSAFVLRDGEELEMKRVHSAGLFELVFPEETEWFSYRLAMVSYDGHRFEFEDPYRFAPVLDEHRLMNFHHGNEMRSWEILGAQRMKHEGVEGALFSVWAPNADAVSVIGSFNHWDGRVHPMRTRGSSGIWELFLPGVSAGEIYKFSIYTKQGERLEKTDPFGRAMELRPRTASVVVEDRQFEWQDDLWLQSRPNRQRHDAPLSIYEVHLGSWRRNPDHAKGSWDWLSYGELAETLLPHVAELGFTHVELMPITEHPFDGSWGYQTLGYFAPTSRYGSPDDLRAFIDEAHRLGIGVILDWVPAHFPTDAHGLAWFDGTHLYEHEDPRRGQHPDWGTLVFNYGRNEVSSFLVSSALYWIEHFHIDGLRVDAVASMLYLDYSRKEGEWIPNDQGGRENFEAIAFLQKMNSVLHGAHPGILTFAEESTAWSGVTNDVADGGLGFDFKWNMGWMNDTLEYLEQDPLFRQHTHDRLTFSLVYAFSEKFLLPLSHDEVVHGKKSLLTKMPGYDPDRFATLRTLYAHQWTHPGKKLLFMGGELGQWGEWNHEVSLDWHLLDDPQHDGIRKLVGALNRLHIAEPSLHERDDSADGFEWIDCHDQDHSVISFLRWNAGWTKAALVVSNFTPMHWNQFRVGVPFGPQWSLAFNGSDPEYGGGHERALRDYEVRNEPWNGRTMHLEVDLPPLTTLIFLADREAMD